MRTEPLREVSAMLQAQPSVVRLDVSERAAFWVSACAVILVGVASDVRLWRERYADSPCRRVERIR